MENMKIIICHHLIKNCPVTNKGVNMDNIMFGPGISMLEGLSTHPKYVQVIEDLIYISK